jgi:hypothetical protein
VGEAKSWKNRIVASGTADTEQLLANPFNYRRRPGMQREALRDSLDELGVIKPVTVNEVPATWSTATPGSRSTSSSRCWYRRRRSSTSPGPPVARQLRASDHLARADSSGFQRVPFGMATRKPFMHAWVGFPS